MRINLRHINFRPLGGLDRWAEEQIIALGETRRIDEANVKIEFSPESSPAFSVHVHLVTPGPDLFAETSDHTLRAAFTKALDQLRETIVSRGTKRLRRRKSNCSTPAARREAAGVPSIRNQRTTFC